MHSKHIQRLRGPKSLGIKGLLGRHGRLHWLDTHRAENRCPGIEVSAREGIQFSWPMIEKPPPYFKGLHFKAGEPLSQGVVCPMSLLMWSLVVPSMTPTYTCLHPVCVCRQDLTPSQWPSRWVNIGTSWTLGWGHLSSSRPPQFTKGEERTKARPWGHRAWLPPGRGIKSDQPEQMDQLR